MGNLLGFRMGMILANFQMLGMLLVMSERLKMSVRSLMACVPRCVRCKQDIPSGPVAEVFFVLRMACSVMVGGKGGVMFVSSVIECSCLRMARSSFWGHGDVGECICS